MAAVLVVDDDSMARKLVREFLVGQDHTISEVADATSALDALRNNHISVALIDRHMPGHDGLWLVERMRDQFPTVAIILATADDAIPQRLSVQPGVVGYLVKPYRRELLVQAVNDGVTWHVVASRRQR